MASSDSFGGATPCYSPGCTRVAFGFHRYCCSECKHSRNGAHGRRCFQRQPVPQDDENAAGAEEQTAVKMQVKNLQELLTAFLPSMSIENRKKWLKDLIRAFHPDRNPELQSSHACTQLLTDSLEKQC